MPGDEINSGGDASKGAEDRKIFVGGIAAEVGNDDLISYFSQFGEVSQAQVKIDRSTGRSRGFAFVEFATAEACKKALQNREQNIKGKPCEVKPAKSRENKKVFVGGLPAEHPEDELRKYFEQFGKVDDVEWPFDKQSKLRRNFAFIVFEEEDAADRAAANPKHTFSDRECDVKKAVPQARRFNNRFGAPMVGGRGGGYGSAGMRGQMTAPGGAPWYNGGWNQMAGMYGNQGTGGGNNWNDWYSASTAGYYGGQGQQSHNAYSGYGGGGDYYGQQNGANARGQGQNGSVGQHYRNN